MITRPLYTALQKYIQDDYTRFHMPGHKGKPIPPFGALTAWDVTELEQTDSLFEDTGALKELESIYTALYNTQSSVLSAGGSTLCIQAMLKLVARPGGKIIAGRNIHNAAVNAMALLGLEPVWVYPIRENETLIGRVSPQSIAEALDLENNVCGVYITSPDYFGVMSDIKAIAELCHAHDVPLLVDNAHGAHLKFLPGEDSTSLHPMDLGADLCCDSLHKTLPALTGAALLHTNNPCYKDDLKSAMLVFGSTSPSYLIMLSCDTTAQFLLGNGKAQIAQTVATCTKIKELAARQGFCLPEHCDPMRITLPLSGTGYSAETFRLLLRKHKIMEEFLSDSGCVFLASPMNSTQDFQRVEEFLTDCTICADAPTKKFPLLHLEKRVSLRDALLASQENLPIEQAAGRVAAQVKSPCPPGIPLVMPGEYLQNDCIQTLKSYGITTINVLK